MAGGRQIAARRSKIERLLKKGGMTPIDFIDFEEGKTMHLKGEIYKNANRGYMARIERLDGEIVDLQLPVGRMSFNGGYSGVSINSSGEYMKNQLRKLGVEE